MHIFLSTILVVLSNFSFSQLNNDSITVNQQIRTYYEFIPNNYQNSESAPLVIILHGIGGLAQNYANYGLNLIADTARFIPVYLQGESNAFNQTGWNNGTLLASNADDLAFIENIIDSMEASYNINRDRVYLVGISMGAIMSYKALHHLSDKITAAVCHIGTMSNQYLSTYNPQFPRPVMQMHGVNDLIVPYAGSPLPSLSLVQPTLDKLKQINGWNSDSTIINIPNTTSDNITIEQIIYDCATPLEHWKMSGSGAGHVFLFDSINDISSMKITWAFLSQYSILTLNTQNSKPSITKPTLYPIPSNNMINFKGLENENYQISIYNLNQQLLSTQQLNGNSINISHLSNGIYLLNLNSKNGVSLNYLIVKE